MKINLKSVRQEVKLHTLKKHKCTHIHTHTYTKHAYLNKKKKTLATV